MAKNQKRARGRICSSSYFLGCFGFSRKLYSDKPVMAAEDGGEKSTKKKKRNKQSSWLSKFRLKNREIKPSPIEETLKQSSSVEDDTQKHVPVISHVTERKNIPVDDKPVNHETKEIKPKDIRDITTDRSKSVELLSSPKGDTCYERSDSARNGKPDVNLSRVRNGSRVKNFDPVIGISIIILTLMIMLICGRLCAILCTSAWCYFLPRIRDAAALAKRKRSGGDGSSTLKKSESYKRKVVSNGFLGRQNRVSLL